MEHTIILVKLELNSGGTVPILFLVVLVLPFPMCPQTWHQYPVHAEQHASSLGEDELQLARPRTLSLDPNRSCHLPWQGFQLNLNHVSLLPNIWGRVKDSIAGLQRSLWSQYISLNCLILFCLIIRISEYIDSVNGLLFKLAWLMMGFGCVIILFLFLTCIGSFLTSAWCFSHDCMSSSIVVLNFTVYLQNCTFLIPQSH